MTPKEVAESNDVLKMQAWYLDQSRTPREILEFMREGRKQLGWRADLVENALAVRISEIAETSSTKLERHTSKLVYLTWMLAALTLGLFILTAIDFLCRGK